MKTSKILGFLVALLVMSMAWTSYAGISADLTLKEYSTDKQGKKSERISKGKYMAQGKKIYVEHQAKAPAPVKPKKNAKGETVEPPKVREPVKQTIIVDNATGKMTRLAHPKKQFVEFDLTMPRTWEQGFWVQSMRLGAIPANEQEYSKHQYTLKAVKVEKLNGHSCQVWKATRKMKIREEEVEIWEARDLDNVPLKVIVKEDGKKTREITLANVKKTEVDVAMFAPPADYTKHEIKVMTGGVPPEMQKKMNQQKQSGPQAQKPRKL